MPAASIAAGITIDWSDFAELSAATPLLARVYPNGSADVNQFQAAGGPAFVLREVMDAGLMHDDVPAMDGRGLRAHAEAPTLQGNALRWSVLLARGPGFRAHRGERAVKNYQLDCMN